MESPTPLRLRPARRTLTTQELAEFVVSLHDLKLRLANAVDDQLRRRHGLSLVWFDAMKAIADSGAGDGPDNFAASLGVSEQEAVKIIAELMIAGHAVQSPLAQPSGSPPVALTLPGAQTLKRAGKTVDRVLHAHLDSILAPPEQELLSESLRALRLRHAALATEVDGPRASSSVQ